MTNDVKDGTVSPYTTSPRKNPVRRILPCDDFRPDQLHVISVLSNPIRYESRLSLFREYVERMTAAGVTLWIVEATFGERKYQVTNDGNVHHIQLRCDSEVWLKEALINAGRRFLPPDAKYIGWQDADIAFVRNDWATEVIHHLQHFPVVQPFSHAQDLGPNFEPMGQLAMGFAFMYRELSITPDSDYYTKMHPGYGWYWRRESWDMVGGMIDIGILGSGDRHMACALVGHAEKSLYYGLHPNYRRSVLNWQHLAKEAVNGNIGYVPGTINHYFHGLKADRKYGTRWKILVEHQFDPEIDIIRDGDGMFRLRGNKPKMRDAIQKYFRARSEDYHP